MESAVSRLIVRTSRSGIDHDSLQSNEVKMGAVESCRAVCSCGEWRFKQGYPSRARPLQCDTCLSLLTTCPFRASQLHITLPRLYFRLHWCPTRVY